MCSCRAASYIEWVIALNAASTIMRRLIVAVGRSVSTRDLPVPLYVFPTAESFPSDERRAPARDRTWAPTRLRHCGASATHSCPACLTHRIGTVPACGGSDDTASDQWDRSVDRRCDPAAWSRAARCFPCQRQRCSREHFACRRFRTIGRRARAERPRPASVRPRAAASMRFAHGCASCLVRNDWHTVGKRTIRTVAS